MAGPIRIALSTLVLVALWPQQTVADEPPSARELIQRFDADNDGKLDRQELERAFAKDKRSDVSFLRVVRDSKGDPTSLQTAVASFRSAKGDLQVDLVGAIHVADKAYYEQLNELFRDYDVVLYELIAPAGTRIPRGGQASDHPVGRMQRAIKSMLDLSFQLDEIDYTAKRLVHADLSPEEFAASMQERGESFLQILFRMMGQAASQAGRADAPSDADLLMALFAPDRPMRLKRILASQFEDLEDQMSILEGPTGSTLISQRNKRALEVLRRQRDLGHTKIAVFYGAGHMSDLAERLGKDFELQHTSSRWLTAWDLAVKAKETNR
jgi:hypothetical protein